MKPSFCLVVVVALLGAVFVSGSTINPVTNLPGWNNVPQLNMTTGYVTVDATTNRNIFYWLISSLGNPATDPLVVWYQGGPGCSGLGGLLSEHGPFTVDMTGNNLIFNDLTWVNNANMLYIEQPAGVGFSYSDDRRDYNTNDTRAADDNYAFLQGFMELFPEYAGRDLWLTGESYGGIYVPDLAAKIILGDDTPLLNQFKGFMIGNPVNGCPEVNDLQVQFNIYYWHGLVSQTNWATWVANDCDNNPHEKICRKTFNDAQNQIGIIDQQLKAEEEEAAAFEPLAHDPSLDPDDLYQDFCTGNGTLEFAVDGHPLSACFPIGNRVQNYLNLKSVQDAIGAIAPPHGWVECTNAINYHVYPDLLNMNPNFELAFKQGLQVLVYSGDVDVATVPMWYTTPCLNALNRTLVDDWKPWFVNDATAGYVQQFDSYTYATVKGAGHETPQYQPLTAYYMFSRFLTKGKLSDEATSKTAKSRKVSRVLKQRDMLRKYGLLKY